MPVFYRHGFGAAPDTKLFRSDINIRLVTKIIPEQLSMMPTPLIFPPDRFS